MELTRRDMGRLALAALPATKIASAKPNSVFAGVQIGINIPYSFHGLPSSADQILEYLAQTNISAAELRTQPIEAYLGAPAAASRGVGEELPPVGKNQPARTADQEAAMKTENEALKKWRLSRSMAEFKAFRKKYEDAGVKIQIVKMDRIDSASDLETSFT